MKTTPPSSLRPPARPSPGGGALSILGRLGRWLGAFLLLALLAQARPAAAQVQATNVVFTNDCLTIICPPPRITNYICSDAFVPQNYPVIVSNRCPNVPPPQVNCTPPPGTPLGPGAHPIHCVISGNGVVYAQCDFVIVVIRDTVPPDIQCPPDMVVHVCPSGAACGGVVNYPPPVASDNSGVVSVSCNPPSGSFFPCGVTVVSCTAFDRCQNFKECKFTVDVRPDGVPPTIQCPSGFTATTCSNCAVVNYPLPVVPPGTALFCVPPAGSCFPIGTTFVICTASNSCGKVSCEFPVVVQPGGNPPGIQCPADILTNTCAPCVNVNYPLPIVNNGALVGCFPPPTTCFTQGVTSVTCRATNACGSADCKFTITVRPGPRPTIQCPPNGFTATTCSNCAIVNFPLPPVSAGASVKCVPPSGSCFPLGTTFVICTASNACGQASCEFPVIVVAGNPPGIQCPGDITVSNCAPCTVVTYPAPGVSGGTLIGCNPPSGFCFPPGATIVTCVASNACGRSECKFTVTVRQGPPPTIHCPTAPITATTCSNCAIVTYPLPPVSAGASVKCVPPSGSCFPIGTTFVICTASNACGQSSCEFPVIVTHGNPPQIQCPTAPVTATTCSNCAIVTYPLPPASTGASVKCVPPSGSCFPIGTTFVICTASNACGQSSCEFPVIVSAGQGPVITCPQDISVTTCSNCAVVNYPAPVVNGGALIGCVPPSGFCFPIGVTTVNCFASNACGRVECKFTVTVRTVPPVQIKCPDDIIVTTCTTVGIPVSYPPPTIIGGPASGVNVFCNPPSGSIFPIGTNRVVCCVVDQCKRTNCCDFRVIVLAGRPCVKPPLNMVLWLPFDELAGVIANNIIPGAPNGLKINGPAPFLGQHVANSLCFDGVNDYVRVPNYAAINLGFSNFSIDTWALRRDPGGLRVIVSKVFQVAGGVAGYEFYLNNGVMNLRLRTPFGLVNYNSGIVVPANNQWHFLAVTVQRAPAALARAVFYLDGVPVANVPGFVNGSVSSAAPLYVGASTFPGIQNFWRGYLDEVEIFRRILTPVEVQQLWLAGPAGKCKIKCAIPWDVSFPPGQQYVTVQARVWNCSALPLPITWLATGPMPIPVPNGAMVIPPFTCVNIPVQLCRPTNNVPVGAVVQWTFTVTPANGCPITCVGSVINPGPICPWCPVPGGIIAVPGTNRPVLVPLGPSGLPTGTPFRILAIGPDMEPDMMALSLNGLPPGTPVRGVAGGPGLKGVRDGVLVRFEDADPIGLYTLLLQADVTGDGELDTLASVDVSNPVIPPPTLVLVPGPNDSWSLDWNDEGDGTLEESPTVDGPWTGIPGARPGYQIPPGGPVKFYRVSVPSE